MGEADGTRISVTLKVVEYRLPPPKSSLAPRALGPQGGAVASFRAPLAAARPWDALLYPEVFAVVGEADLLQPRLDLGLLPAGHAGQDGPRHLLAQQAQRALGQRRRGAIGGVGNQAFQALDGSDVAEYLGRGGERVSRVPQFTSHPHKDSQSFPSPLLSAETPIICPSPAFIL